MKKKRPVRLGSERLPTSVPRRPSPAASGSNGNRRHGQKRLESSSFDANNRGRKSPQLTAEARHGGLPSDQSPIAHGFTRNFSGKVSSSAFGLLRLQSPSVNRSLLVQSARLANQACPLPVAGNSAHGKSDHKDPSLNPDQPVRIHGKKPAPLPRSPGGKPG